MPTVPRRSALRRFPAAILKTIDESKFIYIRAGTEHRFIGIWAVVVGGRVFVRSWSIKPRSWYRTFLEDPRGAVRIGEREIPIHARPATSGPLRDAIDRAYLEKFSSRTWIKYARDLNREKSRATTTELVPAAAQAAGRAASGRPRTAIRPAVRRKDTRT